MLLLPKKLCTNKAQMENRKITGREKGKSRQGTETKQISNRQETTDRKQTETTQETHRKHTQSRQRLKEENSSGVGKEQETVKEHQRTQKEENRQ
jgi:hypothetical protein